MWLIDVGGDDIRVVWIGTESNLTTKLPSRSYWHHDHIAVLLHHLV